MRHQPMAPSFLSDKHKEVLSRVAIDIAGGQFTVKLDEVSSDRTLHREMGAIMNALGGKWKGGKMSAYLFARDPTHVIEVAVNAGLAHAVMATEIPAPTLEPESNALPAPEPFTFFDEPHVDKANLRQMVLMDFFEVPEDFGSLAPTVSE